MNLSKHVCVRCSSPIAVGAGRTAADRYYEVNDGNLEVIIVSPRTILEWGQLAAKVVRRALPGSSRISLPVMRHYVGIGSHWTWLSGAQPIEVDGDLAPSAIRLQARIVPSALSVNVHPDALAN